MRLTKLGRRRQHQREPEVPTAGDQVTTGYEVVEHQGDSQGTYKLELTLPTANFSLVGSAVSHNQLEFAQLLRS